MEKPQMKREVAIAGIGEHCVFVDATKDALPDLQEFGQIVPGSHPNRYQLWVDARYDIADVVAWIKETWK